MQTLTIPYSGRLLVSQMAAFGLLALLDRYGVEAFLYHDPQSLEMTPIVETDADIEAVAECVRRSARECELAVERDVVPGQTGNKRIPAIRARATSLVSAAGALRAREELLDQLEEDDAADLPVALVVGLGAPATWLRAGPKPVPGRGATALDGVPYNIGSDIVRAALRRNRTAAELVVGTDLQALGNATSRPEHEVVDHHRWSPPGISVAPWCQWLAALGLCLLPVGLSAGSAAHTPGYLRKRGSRQLTLPILSQPVSRPRLRALLELRDLAMFDSDAGAIARLRTLGVRELIRFPVLDFSTASMTSFAFDLGEHLQL